MTDGSSLPEASSIVVLAFSKCHSTAVRIRGMMCKERRAARRCVAGRFLPAAQPSQACGCAP